MHLKSHFHTQEQLSQISSNSGTRNLKYSWGGVDSLCVHICYCTSLTKRPFVVTHTIRQTVIPKFKFCKSVHHRTIQIHHQPDSTIFQFIILTFIYSSTRFGRFPAHHQEFNDCSGSLWFYLRIVVIVVLCSCSGRLWGIDSA